jgi:hypothetical protein
MKASIKIRVVFIFASADLHAYKRPHSAAKGHGMQTAMTFGLCPESLRHIGLDMQNRNLVQHFDSYLLQQSTRTPNQAKTPDC